MNRTKIGLVGLLFAGVGTLGGCITADHNRDDLVGVDRRKGAALVEMAGNKYQTRFPRVTVQPMDYTAAEAVMANYGALPNQSLGVYFVRDGKVEYNPCNFTAYKNSHPVPETLRRIEQAIPEGAKRKRFVLGKPDRAKFVSGRAEEHQLNNNCGLLGVDTYSVDGKRDFAMFVRETTGVCPKDGRQQRMYEIDLTFGQEQFRERKERKDWLYGLHVVENTVFSAAFGGARGAGGSLASDAIEELTGRFEGAGAASGTWGADDVTVVGNSSGRPAKVELILRQAKELGAKNFGVASYSKGVGVPYTGDLMEVRGRPDGGITLVTGEKGIEEWKAALFAFVKGMTRTSFSCDGGGDGGSNPGFGGGRDAGKAGTSGSTSGGGNSSGNSSGR